ncbi:MAG: RNA polymerase factor sigma-32 [Deltaproteobacteria bacterium]|nr:RNA polymerase factor sigma-32 [Deltaproteobacteria bacterium]MBN2673940.1 RNA polymerase factor sigma-32 [Deltaproteobacteria bacterium]
MTRTTTTALARVSELDRYMAQIRQYPVLTREEEDRLARKWVNEGDTQAAHMLVTSNLRFVVKIANEYRGYGVRLLDLVQEGSIGLMQAVKRYNPDKGYRLISYAVFWIRSYIHNFLMATTRIFKIGTSRAHRKLFFKLRSFKAMLGAKGTTASDEVIARASEEFGISAEEVAEVDSQMNAVDASLDAPVKETGNALVEVMPADSQNAEDMLSELEAEAEIGALLNTALEQLNERERRIVEQRYLADVPVQLKELGEELGISKQRVAQIEKRALEKLRESFIAADVAA